MRSLKVGQKASILFKKTGKMMKTVKLTLTDTFLRDEKLAILPIPKIEKYKLRSAKYKQTICSLEGMQEVGCFPEETELNGEVAREGP